MFKFQFNQHPKVEVPKVVPRHVGIIMDGNGRWAKKRMQPRVMGHKAGMEALHKVAKVASDMGVQALTVYAFSTENWSRPESEVKFIMNLPIDFYEKYVPELHKNNVKIQMIGNTNHLPVGTLQALRKAEDLTKLNTGLILNFALNYGGRAEIVSAVQQIAQEILDAKYSPGDVDEQLISDHLQTHTLPRTLRDPDLIIRTSGELRLSNFLPWQSAYSELYFTDVLWPDFDEAAFQEAIVAFNKRKRRFGGV